MLRGVHAVLRETTRSEGERGMISEGSIATRGPSKPISIDGVGGVSCTICFVRKMKLITPTGH